LKGYKVVEDIKAYIESGILELYVLGDISPEEKLQVEAMVSKHPAIKAELVEIERSMESYALANAIEPSEHLRDKILNSLVTNLGDDSTFPTRKAPVKDNVIAMPAPKTGSFYKYAFAACLALLIASSVVLINLYNRLQDANTQLVALNTSNQHFTKTVNYMDEQLSIYRDPAFKVIKLNGTPKHTKASMLVAFSPIKKEVMIDLADLNLPENDQAHQYQLWALVNGKPVDLGVFDKTSSSDTVLMKQMKPIALAQAFAVTLEPRGGSVNPTMDQMMVIGTF
jgi:anti-sigma-K factor RskA